MDIPTILEFESGEAKHHTVGTMPRAKLIDELGAFLG